MPEGVGGEGRMSELLRDPELIEGVVMFAAVLLVMVALRIVPIFFYGAVFLAAFYAAAMLAFYKEGGVVANVLLIWKIIGGRSGAGLIGALAAASIVLIISLLQGRRSRQ